MTGEQARIAGEVIDERDRQDAKWGPQSHEDGTGGRNSRSLADFFRRVCQREAEQGDSSWRAILAEEVYEAFAETDPAALREELIQSAAVIVAWVEDIDRKEAAREAAA